MSIGGIPTPSLRQEQAESSRLAWAFIASLVFHLVVFGGYRVGKQYHWWETIHWPAWLQPAKMLTELIKKPDPAGLRRQQQKVEQERLEQQVPLMFVDVNPAKAVAEAPKKADYYSDKNALAANPKPANSNVPRIDGQQTQMPKTEDVPRTQAFPLQPTPPPPEPPAPKEVAKAEPQPKVPELKVPEVKAPPEPKAREVKPVEPAAELARSKAAEPAETPGNLTKAKPADQAPPKPAEQAQLKPAHEPVDLAMAKPNLASPREAGAAPRPRPRTIKEALARQEANGLAGRKMKQDGGVARHGLESSLDVIATPFGAYDAALVAAVQSRWDYLLDQRDFARDRTGKVVLRFKLHPDGTVSEMKIVENTVDLTLALLCQSAIHDPAPYAAWPSDMRRLIGADFRDVTFTFFYN